MVILTLRTDKPEAELALFEDDKLLATQQWQAHRELAETIHDKAKGLLNSQSKKWDDLQGIVCYQGPGSFTGLRIGLSVANALAYSLAIPVIAAQSSRWQSSGIKKLMAGKNDRIALPKYGAEPHVTKPQK